MSPARRRRERLARRRRAFQETCKRRKAEETAWKKRSGWTSDIISPNSDIGKASKEVKPIKKLEA